MGRTPFEGSDSRYDSRSSRSAGFLLSVNHNAFDVIMIDIHAFQHAQPGAWVVDTVVARVHVSVMAGVAVAHGMYEAFGAQVRERRTAMRLTQLELATRIKLTRGSVANIEAGRQSVLLHQFLDIAAALRVEPAQLLPAREEVPTNRESFDMPELVLDAVRSIKLQGARAPAKR